MHVCAIVLICYIACVLCACAIVLPGEDSADESVERERRSAGTVSRASEPEAGDGRGIHASARCRGRGMTLLTVPAYVLYICTLYTIVVWEMPNA